MIGQKRARRFCGFEDVRRDERGYYCVKCGQRMGPHWHEQLNERMTKQLEAQCARSTPTSNTEGESHGEETREDPEA
jgi:hypothetical protein